MNKIKLVVGIILLLLLGALAGSVGTGIYIRHRIEHIRPAKPPKAHFLLRKLSRELDLTETQQVEIGKILEESHTEITALRRKFLPEIKDITDQSFAHIKEKLDKEQKQKLDKLHGKLKRWRKRGHFLPPPLKESPERIFSDINKRLKLSEKQKEEVRPIIVKSIEAQRELIEKFREQFRLERNALRNEIKKTQESMATRLDTILTGEQMKAFRHMLKKHRKQINSEMRLLRSGNVKQDRKPHP
jgi:hypothetical protein